MDEPTRKALLVAVKVPRRSAQRLRKMKHRRPTNPELLSAIGYLMKAGKQYQTPLWITVARVLGSGEPKEKLTIAAFKFSPRALVKVEKAGGRCIPFSRLVEENPRGTNVRLLR